MESVRVAFVRGLAAVLVVAQLSAYALSPWAESRAGGASGSTPTVEASHSEQCVVVHRPDHCLACQLLTARAVTPPAPGATAAMLRPVARRPAPSHAADTGAAAPLLRRSRAPPASA